MRRPLCLLCMVFIGVLALCLRLMPEPKPDYGELDGQRLTVEGQVYKKEYKTQKFGSGQTLVIYLKAVHILERPGQGRDASGHSRHSGQSEQTRYSEQSGYSEQSEQSEKETMQSGQISPYTIENIICYMEDGGFAVPEIGTLLRVNGKVRCFSPAGNKGEFDREEYYRTRKLSFGLEDARLLAYGGKASALGEGLFRLKTHFAAVLGQVFPETEASVMKAMLLGEKDGLDEEIKELYRDSSVIHILSISGLHISVIGMGLYRILRKIGLSVKAGAVLSGGLIGCYGIMTGMSLSAARAIFMFLLHLTADMAGRTYDMLTALALAAAVLLMEQPLYMHYSGFLFSFGAVASIGLLLPALYKEKRPEKKKRLWKLKCKLKQAAAAGGAVTLGTLPVHLMFYYQFPWYSFLLNLAVIPLMPIVMADGLFCMLIGGFAPACAEAAGYIGRAVLWFYEQCCKWGGRIPYGVIRSGRPENWQIAVYVLLLAVLAAAVHIGKGKLTAFWKCQWILAALCVLFLRTESGLQVTMLDVGQGDCIHIRSGEGRHYLIDGGSSTKSGVAEYQLLPYLKQEGVKKLEAVFVTHSDSDHCNAVLDMLEEYPAEGITLGSLILPAVSAESTDGKYVELAGLAEEKGVEVQYMSRGQYVEDGQMRLTCMHPLRGYDTREPNEYSLVLLLEYGGFSGLFTGDVEGDGEEEAWEYMQAYLPGRHAGGGKREGEEREEEEREREKGEGADLPAAGRGRLTLLKVAHHGSAYSTKEEMLSVLRPRLALISCGKSNGYGHPHEELLERLENAGCRICVTARCGAVTVRTDGEKLWVEEFR